MCANRFLEGEVTWDTYKIVNFYFSGFSMMLLTRGHSSRNMSGKLKHLFWVVQSLNTSTATNW